MSQNNLVYFLTYFRTGLSNLMKSRKVDLEVKLLLFAIQKTTTFEKFLASRFVTSEYMESVSQERLGELTTPTFLCLFSLLTS